MHHTTV